MAGNAIAGAGGAAAGAVVAGAVVAARYELKEAVQSSKQAKEKAQMAVINSLFAEHLGRYSDPDVVEQARRTDIELFTMSPAFPQVKLAFDAVLSFQRENEQTMLEYIQSWFASTDKDHVDPKTRVCEILKAWLQTKCEDVDIHITEVEAYRNFARGFLLHTEFTSGRFVQMICHVVRHLGGLGDCLLRQKQDCTKYIKALRKEAYNFVLHAVKLLLLGPTSFEVPKEMYSTDSLGWLRRTAMVRSMHASEFDQELSEKLKPEWATTSGSIMKAVLCSEHGASFCNLMEGVRLERSAKPLLVKVHSADHLPLFTEVDIGGIDPFVKVSVHFSDAGIQKVFSEATTKVQYNTTKPVWDETLEISVLANKDCYVQVEVLDYHTLSMGMVQGKACAKVEDISATEALEQAGAGEQRWLPLVSTDDKPKPLGKARVLLGFSHPSLDAEMQAAQKRWERGDFNAKRDGLISDDFCMCFLHAVQETDSLVYFLDVLFNECLEIAQSLGNLGMVLCARLMRPLLDEIEMRLISVEKVIDNELINLVYNNMVAKKLSESRWSRLLGWGKNEVNPKMGESARKLQGIKAQMLSDLSELRQMCCDRYNSGHDVLMEAQSSIESLVGRIGGPDAVKRSGRFANAATAIPGLDKILPSQEKAPALEDASSPGASKKKKKGSRAGGSSPVSTSSTGVPSSSSKSIKSQPTSFCFAPEEEWGEGEQEELRINPSDGQPMTFTDLRFFRVGASEAVLAQQWAAMRPLPGIGSGSDRSDDEESVHSCSDDSSDDGTARPRAKGNKPPEPDLSDSCTSEDSSDDGGRGWFCGQTSRRKQR